MGLLSLVPEAISAAIQNQLRADSWVSAVLGLGGVTDKTMGARFRAGRVLSPEQCMELFTSNDLARLICTVRPATALRRGFTIQIGAQDDQEQEAADSRESQLSMRLEELGALQGLTESAIWGLTTGGSCILVGVDDSQLPEEPIRVDQAGNPQGVRRVQWLKVYDRRRLQIARYELDPMQPHYGCPSHYRIQAYEGHTSQSILVHASRLIVLPGVLTGDYERIANSGFDHSTLQACYDVLQEFGLGWKSATYLLTDASQAVYSVKGLNSILSSDSGESTLQARMRVTEMSRSVARALVIDADGEKFEKVATNFTGVPDLLDRLCNRLAAAARIPVSILMGQAPAGLNATGQADLETFYGEMLAWQRDVARPAIRRLARLVMAEDGAKEPDVWRVEFPPVNPNHDTAQAALRKTVAEQDKLYFDMGVCTSDEIAVSRFGDDGWSPETTIDLEMRRLRVGDPTAEPTDPLAEPTDPAGVGQPPDAPASNAALSGVQVTSLVEIIKSVIAKEIPRDAAVQVIMLSYNVTAEQADKLLGTAGKGFEAPTPSAPSPTPSPNQLPEI